MSGSNGREFQFGDLDGDGDLDIFLTVGSSLSPAGPNEIWLNQRGILTDSGIRLGTQQGEGVDLGDVDGDGDLDAFVTNAGSPSGNTVWLNDTRSCRLCGDCDQDGDVDILDALRAAQLAAGLIAPAPIDFFFCNVYRDGDIDIIDALLMAQFAAGLPVMLNCP